MAKPTLSLPGRRQRIIAASFVLGLATVGLLIWTTPGHFSSKTAAASRPKSSGSVPAAKPKISNPFSLAADNSRLRSALAASQAARLSADAHVVTANAALDAANKELAAAAAAPPPPAPAPASATGEAKPKRAKPVPKKGSGTNTNAAAKAAKWIRCSDFHWQQDAQAAYVADLADPFGLDGSPGRANDDGLACTSLPVDPARPASTPTAPYVAPKPDAPTKAELLAGQRQWFGVYTEQAPYAWTEMEQAEAKAGREPNAVGTFLGWDQDFRPDGVQKAWEKGTLPMLTWESTANLALDPDADRKYQLSNIIDGSFDAYIDKFASDVKALGLPMVIRFDHEMNGAWYPWSEKKPANARGEYVQAWRHVVDRFRAIGADQYVIWLWAPNRVDSVLLNGVVDTDIARYYPGDDYVDWIGVDGYYRWGVDTPSFDFTFGRTLPLLRSVDSTANKPILIAEVGATEEGGHKAQWINSFFDGLADPRNSDIIGFAWFNLTITSTERGVLRTNDWRFFSSTAAKNAFAARIADPRYG
ncbi:MAG: hypothetical protein EPO13_01510 [Actinomycetota bacterium]|nr:MAG: hypothetical protein EPO13_01510 [Actinomycetota bacterium]